MSHVLLTADHFEIVFYQPALVVGCYQLHIFHGRLPNKHDVHTYFSTRFILKKAISTYKTISRG